MGIIHSAAAFLPALFGGDSVLAARTTNASITLKKPLTSGNFQVVVRTDAPTDARSSRSNALDFVVEVKDMVIYTVITPNSDGLNDVLKIENLQFYPGTQLYVFNRRDKKFIVRRITGTIGRLSV